MQKAAIRPPSAKEKAPLSVVNLPLQPRGRSRKAAVLMWLRQTHRYVGLIGAAMGLLLGLAGIILNQRAALQMPHARTIVTSAQLPVPQHGFATPSELAAWLQQQLQLPAPGPKDIRQQQARQTRFGGMELTHPAVWTVRIRHAERGVQAEFYPGNRYVKVDLQDATPLSTLVRLHVSLDIRSAWILLADAIAAGLLLMSLSGVLLWTQLNPLRLSIVLSTTGTLLVAGGMVWVI